MSQEYTVSVTTLYVTKEYSLGGPRVLTRRLQIDSLDTPKVTQDYQQFDFQVTSKETSDYSPLEHMGKLKITPKYPQGPLNVAPAVALMSILGMSTLCSLVVSTLPQIGRDLGSIPSRAQCGPS